jgi:hypothetical protein
VKLELRGTPAVFVAADTFQRAAQMQAEILPLNPPRVFLPGPIASRTPSQIHDMAEQSIVAIVAALVTKNVPDEEGV